ncbi:MAG: glutamate-5-semialdehyde dehydrogenase [Leptolyngbyaceae cyanobacterium bins.59]|nr:glutamate-5-semialdehyde dehydrogenase [Leptolyngbyaceae cyanobacterium bins.59]
MVMDAASIPEDLLALVRRSHQASLKLATAKGADRSRALQAMAKALKNYQNDILEANTLDLEASREMAVPELLLDWLRLTPERIQEAVQILQRLSELPDPIGRMMNASFQVANSQTYSQLVPLGVIALVYEAFPDLAAIASGLCLKTGNCLILKGGSEASHTNALIAQALQSALKEAGMPEGCLENLSPEMGISLRDLLTQDQYVNLIIPYGRPSLVQQVIRQATAPVLKSAMGNCYLYWSPSGSLDTTRWIIIDSHQSSPDPVNAIEKVLVHKEQSRSSLLMLWNSLKDKGFQLRGDARLVAEFPELPLAPQSEWATPYLDKIVSFKLVDGLDSAISWINLHSSGHADCIVTESYQESRQFALGVNSASAYINASPRFSRNSKQGDAIFLGMSNQKGHRRGLIGPESLTTVKHIFQGGP